MHPHVSQNSESIIHTTRPPKGLRGMEMLSSNSLSARASSCSGCCSLMISPVSRSKQLNVAKSTRLNISHLLYHVLRAQAHVVVNQRYQVLLAQLLLALLLHVADVVRAM